MGKLICRGPGYWDRRHENTPKSKAGMLMRNCSFIDASESLYDSSSKKMKKQRKKKGKDKS